MANYAAERWEIWTLSGLTKDYRTIDVEFLQLFKVEADQVADWASASASVSRRLRAWSSCALICGTTKARSVMRELFSGRGTGSGHEDEEEVDSRGINEVVPGSASQV